VPADDETLTVYGVGRRRACAATDPANVTLHFDAAVLERYRGAAGFSLIRTDTVARVRKQGGWSLDFGIAPGEATIHVFAGDLLALPAEEREYWVAFATLLPASRMFLQMRLAPGACHDDGEVRNWE
jgi:hypothetical protein